MKCFRLFISIILVSIIITSAPIEQNAEASSEWLGENVTWTLNSEGLLTISGTGPMYDWESTLSSPVDFYRDRVKEIVIEEGITTVGAYALCCCDYLEKLTIPSSVKIIGKYAFYDCPKLQEVTLSNGLEEIKESAFYECNSLLSLVIPNSVKKASIGCNLQYLETPINDEISIPYSLHKLVITNADTIPCRRFTGYNELAPFKQLTELILPGNLSEIEEFGCAYLENIESLVIPASVETIGNSAFYDCFNLQYIKFEGSAPEIAEGMLNNNITTTIYYPLNDSTWDDEIGKNYCGNVTWVGYTPEETNPIVNTEKLLKIKKDYQTIRDIYFGRIPKNTEISSNLSIISDAYLHINPMVTAGSMPNGITYMGSSLILEDTLTIRHFFTVDNDNMDINAFSFVLDGDNTTPLENYQYYTIDISGIEAKDFGTTFFLTIHDGDDFYTIGYSIFSYIDKAMTTQKDENLINLMKILYLYYSAANNIFFF